MKLYVGVNAGIYTAVNDSVFGVRKLILIDFNNQYTFIIIIPFFCWNSKSEFKSEKNILWFDNFPQNSTLGFLKNAIYKTASHWKFDIEHYLGEENTRTIKSLETILDELILVLSFLKKHYEKSKTFKN